MVVRMRHTRSQRGNTRSHHALVASAVTLCKECGSPKLPHTLCKVCGKYNGKQVIDVHKEITKKKNKSKASSSK